MNPQPLRARIPSALALQPMTASQLRRVLGAGWNNLYSALSVLVARGEIERCERLNNGHGHGRDKPYRLVRA